MILSINTSDRDLIVLQIIQNEEILFKESFKAKFRQAEKLLVEIDKLLIKSKVKLKSLKKIQVESQGESFTSLRIGVITANALAFALGIPAVNSAGKSIKKRDFSLVKPEYSQEPDITISKK